MAPRRLVPLPAPADARLLDLMPNLAAALRGDGPAIHLHAAGTTPDASLGAGSDLLEAEDDAHDPTVAVVATSGSSGAPKGVLLQASALLASASATHDRLGGPGRWVLALPAWHVAGLQVLVRCLIARVRPVVCDLTTGFDPAGFAGAVAALTGPRRYTALVPTQLGRLLDSGVVGLTALRGLDAVLVGGAAVPPALLARARESGVAVVTTYGMSETCGGCVYDGVPLDGVHVSLDAGSSLDAGRISLGGPVVARGYRGGADSAFSTDSHSVRWFTTADTGSWDGTRLAVRGRLDDVVVTGGVKVAPAAVEAVLLAAGGLAEAAVVGVPDTEWGARVVAAVVPAPGSAAPTLDRVRARVKARLGAAAAPQQLLVLPAMPLAGPGKPDRAELRRLAGLEAS